MRKSYYEYVILCGYRDGEPYIKSSIPLEANLKHFVQWQIAAFLSIQQNKTRVEGGDNFKITIRESGGSFDKVTIVFTNNTNVTTRQIMKY